MKTEGGGEGYPLVFDINLDQMGATNRLQYLIDGLFLDNATDTLTLKLVTYNGQYVSYWLSVLIWCSLGVNPFLVKILCQETW
jgi:hypothetical protein